MLRAFVLIAASLTAVDPARMLSTLTSNVGEGDEDEFQDAIERLEQTNKLVNNDPEKHLDALANAIERVETFRGQLADDTKASVLLDLATLNLVRAMLRADRSAEAAETMDELLRRTGQSDLPVKQFGPTLVRFHDERVEQLRKQGTARLEIECEIQCEILLDRRRITRRSGPLYLGTYEVMVVASDASLPPEYQTVELVAPGELVELHYPMAGLSDEPTPAPATMLGPPPRIAPRWAEVLLTVVGIGAVGASGALLALDGRCTGGAPPVDADGIICPQIYEHTAVGAVTLGLGAITMTTGIVLLSVDAVQGKRGQDGTQAMAHYRWRF